MRTRADLVVSVSRPINAPGDGGFSAFCWRSARNKTLSLLWEKVQGESGRKRA